jgi:superfamily II DNA or RNA helicase
LIVEAGAVPSTRSPYSEPSFAMTSEWRALVLRRLADLQKLEAIRSAAIAKRGERSLAGFTTALYGGELARLAREIAALEAKFTAEEAGALVRARLREAVSARFDAAWFERTWGAAAPILAERVLSDALWGLEPVSDLYAWASSRGASASLALQRTLAEHALLRGETRELESLSARAVAPERLALSAARHFVDGDLPSAQRSLDEAMAHFVDRTALALGSGSVVLFLALLALGRDSAEGRALAKRLLLKAAPPIASGLTTPAADSFKSGARSLRALLRDLSEPRSDRVPLSAHQLAPDASAWEALIWGLNTQLHVAPEVPRAAWGRRLTASCGRWSEAGYAWFAWQASRIAEALGADMTASLAPGTDFTLALVDMLRSEPEWRKSLAALTAFVGKAERAAPVRLRRVAWFVDMATGALGKPMLEEFHGSSGWAGGRRVELSELLPLQGELPPEDVAVLRSAQSTLTRPELGPEALDALVGHPRVFNGARGRLKVDVLRGTCRIETRQEHGHIVLRLEPTGLVEGVNVVVESESRLAVYRVSEPVAKLATLLPGGIRVPQSHAKDALPILAQLADHVEVHGSELAAVRRSTADSTPCLRISPETGAFFIEAGVRPFATHGRFFPPGVGRAAVAAYEAGELFESRRDLHEETVRFRELVAACPTFAAALREAESDAAFSVALGEEALFTLLTELAATPLAFHLEWKNGRPIQSRGTLGSASLHGKLRRDKGWYLVTGGVRIDAVTDVALAELVSMPFTKTGRFLRLPSGDFVEVERRIHQVLTALAAAAAPEGPGALKLSAAAFDALRPLVDLGGDFEVDAAAPEWLSLVDSLRAREYPLPAELNATLRPYQIEGYEWLRRSSDLGLGVCLADDMGLGKTLQVLALLLHRAESGPALVVTPTSVSRNWMLEIARFAPTLRAHEYGGKDRAPLLKALGDGDAGGPDIVVTSYALLQQDADAFAAVTWNTVVLDEAQFIKNARSLRAKAAFRLQGRYRVALTGTPVENHLGDLWSIFHFLNETLLGTFKHFQVRYLTPIERDRDSERRIALRQLMLPFILRRTKQQVLADLPPITVLNHEVRFSEDEALRYAMLRRRIHDKLYTPHGKREHKIEIFSELTRLRRFCCHPRLVFPDAPLQSAKIQSFIELVEELRQNGHRALVFSQFVDFLALVREELDERGIEYVYLDGSTPKETRHANVAAFQAGQGELFLISLKAGGFGLNLTAADYVIHLDPWWNPAVEAQATDRAHRIGQERPVTVYRLIAKDTIEERIQQLHEEKRELADAVLEGSDLALSMSLEDIGSLLEQRAL